MTLTIRPLTCADAADAARVQALLASSPGYTRRVSGREVAPGDGAAVLSALPPGVDRARKTVLGLLDADGGLLALCDVIAHWPEPGTAHIGLLLVREDRAGRGLGRLLHDSVLAQLRAGALGEGNGAGIERLRAGIVASNAEGAEPFWRAIGYEPTGEVRPYRDGDVENETAIWARPLADRPAGVPAGTPGLHHLELWTADLAAAEPAWDWLLTALGWSPERVDGWALGRIWRHADGSYVVLEQSDDVAGARTDRLAPGMNHVALTIADRAALDDLRAGAAEHGWRELFGERYPRAGGEDHTAWYGESAEGIEVEIVAAPRG